MKKVLLILYYWPPAGGPGVQRWLKFVTYFKQFDIEPILYIPSNPHYPLKDDSLLNELPEDLKIYSQPIKEPYRWASLLSKKNTDNMSSGVLGTENKSLLSKLMLFVRGNFFIPDARKSWVKPSITYLKSVLTEEGIDTVITTGPPHSLHLIGMGLKRELSLKWIADFRDPWTSIHYQDKLYMTPLALNKHKKMESKVLRSADAISVTSPSTKMAFESITQSPVHLITNGYDTELPTEPRLDTHFSITHIGSLLSERNPKILWRALEELCEEVSGFKDDLKLVFVGKTDRSIIDQLADYTFRNQCENVGYVPHNKAIDYQRKSQLLLLLESFDPKVAQIIPGKLFEYLSANRPIIAIGPESWDVDLILLDTKAGTTYTFDDINSLKSDILTYYRLYKKGQLTIDSSGINAYHRRSLAEKMSKVLWEL
jgi:hypothetical protein